jgi:hypothetical protein
VSVLFLELLTDSSIGCDHTTQVGCNTFILKSNREAVFSTYYRVFLSDYTAYLFTTIPEFLKTNPEAFSFGGAPYEHL